MYCLSRVFPFVPILVCLAIPAVPLHAVAYDVDALVNSATVRDMPVTGGDQPASLGNVLKESKVAGVGRPSVAGKLRELVVASQPSGDQLIKQPDGHETAPTLGSTTGAQQQQAPMPYLALEHKSHANVAVSRGPGLWLDALRQRVQSRATARRKAQQRQLLQQGAAGGGLSTSGASPASSTPESSEPDAAAEGAADAGDAADSSVMMSTSMGSRSSSAYATAAVQTDGGTPYSCMSGSYKYAHLELVLDMPVSDATQLSTLQDKVSKAIAQQLRLTDAKGNVDASRVETYVVTVDASNESVDLDVFIYFSSSNCEVFMHTWMQSVQHNPARLFRTDSVLQSDVVNVTANFADPGRASKQLILASSNAVISVSLGAQVTSDNRTGSSSTGTSLYNWFFTSGSVSKVNVDGLMVMGVSTSVLILVFVLLVFLRRYVRRRASQRAEAEVTAAAQAAASARQQAALDVPEQETGDPAPTGTHAAGGGASNS